MNGKRRKIFVLGLDGATFDLIHPWANQGFLPAFADLLNESSYGELESTIPPYSAQAWTTFMTGVNAGKHDIYDIVDYKPNTYDRILKNTLNIRSKKIWDLIGEFGKRSIIINVPLTHPPQRINGILISGMLTPLGGDFASPKEIEEELKKAVGSYIIDIDASNYRDMALVLKNIYHVTEQRFKAAQYLMDHYDWDLFVMVVTETDRIQHFFWGKKQEVLLSYYRRLDSSIGHLLNHLNDNTTFIMLSDHGFGELKKTLYLNAWLAKLGLLGKAKKRGVNEDFIDWDFLFGKKGNGKPRLSTTNRCFRGVLKGENSLYQRIRRKLIPRDFDIDWTKTKAFVPYSGQIHGISLNVKGRQPQGIVDPKDYEGLRDFIAYELYRLKDEDDGRPIIQKVFKREEIYSGPSIDRAPDLLFTLEEYSYFISSRIGRHVFKERTRGLGTHSRNGIIIFNGKGIRKNREIGGSRIIDIPPTILYLMKIPVPKALDGRVLKEIFQPTYLRDNPIEYHEKPLEIMDRRSEVELSNNEIKEIEERLRGLGYIP